MIQKIKECNKNVLVPALKWMQNHKKGVIVFAMVMYGIFIAISVTLYFWDDIVKRFEKFTGKEES